MLPGLEGTSSASCLETLPPWVTWGPWGLVELTRPQDRPCSATASGSTEYGTTWARPRGNGENGDYQFPYSPTPKITLSGQARKWARPDASLINDAESPESFHKRRAELKARHKNGNGAGTPLAVQVKMWPRPMAHDTRARSEANAMNPKGGGRCLAREAKMWGRPTASNGRERWETPEDYLKYAEKRGQKFSLGIYLQAKHYPRPAPSPRPDAKTPKDGPMSSDTLDGSSSPPSGPMRSPRLNVWFVEWLMGFPAGWVILLPTRNRRLKALGNAVNRDQALPFVLALDEVLRTDIVSRETVVR